MLSLLLTCNADTLSAHMVIVTEQSRECYIIVGAKGHALY